MPIRPEMRSRYPREWVESGHLLLRRVKTKITEKQFRAALAELGKRARGAS